MAKLFSIGEECLQGIRARLGQLAPLPPAGILAGQALASALAEELGAGPGVYNDIDIFVLADPDRAAQLASDAHRDAEALRLGVPSASLDEYRMLALSSDHDLDILGATQEGLLNYVWCKPSHTSFTPSRVVQSFDLNAVEIALDLETGHLVWSRAFEYFLQTQELQVTSLNTPGRTLLRYFKKREELQAYGNDTLVVELIASWLDWTGTHRASTEAKVLLTQKFWPLAERYASRWSGALHWDPLEHTVTVGEHWQYPEGMEDLLAAADTEGSESEGCARLICKMAYGSTLRRSSHLEAALKSAQAEFARPENEGSLVQLSLATLGCDYLADQRSERHFAVVSEVLATHPGLCTALFELTLEEQYHCVLDLKRRAKKEGPHIYGMVEAEALSLDVRTQYHRDAFFAAADRRDSGTPLVTPLFQEFQDESVHIQELLTAKSLRLEGAMMGHCVGGYDTSVSAGRCRVLSVRTGTHSKAWSTVEVRLRKELSAVTGAPDAIRVDVFQHYGPKNARPVAENTQALNQYLRDEAQRLGYVFKPSDWRALSFADALAAA